MKLQGIFIDTTTPFDHSGDLYRVKIEHNIGKWNQTSVTGYVIGGFTGEGALLAAEEKSELWRIAAGSVGVIEADSSVPDEFAFEQPVKVQFPDKDGYGPAELATEVVSTELARRFIDRTAWMFYVHEEPYYPKY